MMLLMSPSIVYSFSLTSTTMASAFTSGSEVGMLSSLGSKLMWGDWRSVAFPDVYMRWYFSRSIPVALMVVYYSGAGVGTKGKSYRKTLLLPQLYCMLIQDLHLYWCAGMQHQGRVPQSGYVLKVLLGAWLRSYGVFWWSRRCRNMTLGCLSLLVYIVLGRIIHGWRIF